MSKKTSNQEVSRCCVPLDPGRLRYFIIAMSTAHFVAILILLLVIDTAANSFGRPSICDAHANFGCSSWEGGDRLKCDDPDQGYMPWASAPVRSNKFSLEFEDDSLAGNGYTPGGHYLTIILKTNDYNLKFRGLL